MLTRDDIKPHQHLFNSQDWKEFNKPEHNRFLVDPTAKVFSYLLKHKNTTDPYKD